MLLRRDKYLVFVNYLSFIFVTLHLLHKIGISMGSLQPVKKEATRDTGHPDGMGFASAPGRT